jgi:hypothetical protein
MTYLQGWVASTWTSIYARGPKAVVLAYVDAVPGHLYPLVPTM